MEVCVKPACCDSVPPRLGKKCQMYDVKMSSRPVAKPNPSTLWSSVSTVAESTFGLCDAWGVCDAKRLCCEDTAETDPPRARSRYYSRLHRICLVRVSILLLRLRPMFCLVLCSPLVLLFRLLPVVVVVASSSVQASPVVIRLLFALLLHCLPNRDPPVKMTCWCTPSVFRRSSVCIGLVRMTGRHCTTPVNRLKYKKNLAVLTSMCERKL